MVHNSHQNWKDICIVFILEEKQKSKLQHFTKVKTHIRPQWIQNLSIWPYINTLGIKNTNQSLLEKYYLCDKRLPTWWLTTWSEEHTSCREVMMMVTGRQAGRQAGVSKMHECECVQDIILWAIEKTRMISAPLNILQPMLGWGEIILLSTGEGMSMIKVEWTKHRTRGMAQSTKEVCCFVCLSMNHTDTHSNTWTWTTSGECIFLLFPAPVSWFMHGQARQADSQHPDCTNWCLRGSNEYSMQ